MRVFYLDCVKMCAFKSNSESPNIDSKSPNKDSKQVVE